MHTKGSETMFCSVDRIEEGLAVCVNDMGVTFAVRLSDISGEVHEGSVLIDTGSGYIACLARSKSAVTKISASQRAFLMKTK